MKSNGDDVAAFENVRSVFLDRDGVVNRKAAEGGYVSRWDHFEILPGVESAIVRLNEHNCRVFIVSNQRGIALGLYSDSDVEHLHERFRQHLAKYGGSVDGFYYCPHDKGQCTCRKPALGLFEQAVRDFPDTTAVTSLVIGDSLSDIEAARGFGCRSIFIKGDPGTRKAGADEAAELADGVVESLCDAIDLIFPK